MSKNNDDYIKRVGKLEFDLTYKRSNIKNKNLELIFKVYVFIIYSSCLLFTFPLTSLLSHEQFLAKNIKSTIEARREVTLNIYKTERLKLGKKLDIESETAMNAKQELLLQDDIIELSCTIQTLEPIVNLNIFFFTMGVIPIGLMWVFLKIYNIKIIYKRK